MQLKRKWKNPNPKRREEKSEGDEGEVERKVKNRKRREEWGLGLRAMNLQWNGRKGSRGRRVFVCERKRESEWEEK